MKISEFSKYLQTIEDNASRNFKIEELSKLFKKLNKDEIKPCMYMLDARIGPRFLPVVYNYSSKLMLRTLDELSDLDVRQLYKKYGDMGQTSQEVREGLSNKPKNYIIEEVYTIQKEIALLKGKGSQEAKMRKTEQLFLDLDPLSTRYVSRMILGNLRLGLNDKTVLDALSWAVSGDKSLRDQIERAYGVRSDLGLIAEIVLLEGVDKLDSLSLQVGVPLASKLVEREKDAEAIIDRLGTHLIQPKYDGLRAQIHMNRKGFKNLLSEFELKQTEPNLLNIETEDEVAIYSRNMDNITKMFPDIVKKMKTLENVESAILDSEVIGYDPSTKDFVPFQETIQRKRKYGIKGKADDIPVQVFIFDCLYLNGKDLTLEPLDSRMKILEKIIPKDDTLKVSENIIVKNIKELNRYFQKYVDQNLEGIISKKLDSIYKPGTRDYDWIKLKASSRSELVDTVDATIIGYYLGRGARAKFGIGALLVAVYNRKKDKFESLAKIGTGIKDDEWLKYKKVLDELKVPKKPDDVVIDKELYPDVWVEPKIVSEIEADEITKSKNHTAGRSKSSQYGYSLRFPRMKNFSRDKQATECTTVEEIIKMYSFRKK
jgi:DNA ligase-1